MEDSTVKKIEKAKAQFEALARRSDETRSVTITALLEAAGEELGKKKDGRFIWLKNATFKGVQYQPGDVITADVIGLENKARAIIHQHRTIQPEWHVKQGEAHSRYEARLGVVRPQYDELRYLENQQSREAAEIETLKAALKEAQSRLKQTENEIGDAVDSLLAMPELKTEM